MLETLNHSAVLKRTLDYAVGIPLFVVALPVIGLLALLIRLISPGSPFFVQEREGLHGRPIYIWKLRTMYVDADARLKRYLDEHPERAEEWRTIYKLDNDPRVLPWIGTFFRKSSLDELPNLWNLIRGDIGLVGPRPFPMYHVADFDPTFRALRITVRPGLTGIWQLRRGGIEAQTTYDTDYIQNWSNSRDLSLLFQTIPVMIQGKALF